MNEGEDDYNGTYKLDNDGYELKIRNTIDLLCPSVANSLIDISFEKEKGVEYCKIEVRKAKRPIWMNGSQLYVRQGNRTKLFKGDEITFYITERMNLSIKEVIDTEGLDFMSIEKIRETLREILNERNVSSPKASMVSVNSSDEIDYWVVWYNDGRWKRMRNKSDEDNILIQCPVLKPTNDKIVVFCYDSGKVNVVKLSDFKKKVNLNVLQEKGGWCNKANTPMSIYITNPNDYLAGYSIDEHGIEKVKLHSLTDFQPTASANNQGSTFVPEGCKASMYKLVCAQYYEKLNGLRVSRNQKSINAGFPISSPALSDAIEFLNNL